jgi:HK97 family phage major capsid protein
VREACRAGGHIDRRLIEGGLMAAPTNVHSSAGAEGAMVPPAMRTEVWQLVFNDPLLDLLTVEPTASPTVDLIGDETTPWGATGIQAYWRSEAGQMTASKLDTKPKQVRVHPRRGFTPASCSLAL